MLFKRISGIYGTVNIPSIGLNIATMSSWSLQRREDTPPGSGEWDLRAVFSFINQYAWDKEGYKKEIIVTIGNQKNGTQYRLTPTTGRMVLDGKSLLIEGVQLDVR